MAETFYTFYGVRGSYPVAGDSVKKYGGNTTSLLIEKDKDIIIFDAGTGIINLGEYLKTKRSDVKDISIFITHYHLDHIMGVSFFSPLSDKDYKIKIYYPDIENSNGGDVLFNLIEPPYSPIGKEGIHANIEMIGLNITKDCMVSINKDLTVAYHYDTLHPVNGVMLYKLETGAKKLVFATDIESVGEFAKNLKDFIFDSDVLIHDSQYLDEDYNSKTEPTKGYGHSTFDMAVQNAIECNTKKLFLFHHNPLYSDEKLEGILGTVRKKFKNSFLARELDKNIL